MEILNENDNLPVFAEGTVQSLILSEVLRKHVCKSVPEHTKHEILTFYLPVCLPAGSSE